jgi:hypothetical protein
MNRKLVKTMLTLFFITCILLIIYFLLPNVKNMINYRNANKNLKLYEIINQFILFILILSDLYIKRQNKIISNDGLFHYY